MAHRLGGCAETILNGLEQATVRIFEINTRVHCDRFDQVTQVELDELAQLGFDSVWMMGVWRISEGARKISKITADDFDGSPYAVPAYEINRDLGGRASFARLVNRAHAAGLSVIVDFVSNHTALDSPWILSQPDLFVRSDTRARNQSTNQFFLHKSGDVIAFGRDPYFAPWNDTAQLDYANPSLRARMINELKRISSYADGVRCDMAMLVLRDCFRQLWYPLEADSSFDERWPVEFWEEATSEVTRINPNFKFIAEAYWDKESRLRSLGFDLCYEKKLYDGLVARDAGRVLERLNRDKDALLGSLYFIENHDEPRAASVFGRSGNLAAAALILSIPGSVLIHEGQMEGKLERLPVQRVRPLNDEQPDLSLRDSYRQLLEITADDVFKQGDFQLFDPNVYGAIGIIRRDHRRVVAFLTQISDAWHRFNSASMDLSSVARAAEADSKVRLTNLLTSTSTTIDRVDGSFRIELNRIGVDEATQFCLLETFPA